MGVFVRMILRLLVAPIFFLIIGSVGIWNFVFPRKDEDEDGQPTNHDIVAVAPDDNEEDKKRTYARDRWAMDLDPLDRCYAVQNAMVEDGSKVAPNPVPVDVWYANRVIKRK